jgi:hypothetical protein
VVGRASLCAGSGKMTLRLKGRFFLSGRSCNHTE